MQERLGMIGLGIMGKPMAKNLLRAGFDLTVSARRPEVLAELAAVGAHVADQAVLGENCDVVLTMLPNGPQVREVLLGDRGAALRMAPGSVVIDMSSINPVDAREIAGALAERGIDMLDAPVSGGEPKAVDGTLSFMVGGKEAVFDRCRPILEAMGSSVVRCGEVGAGVIFIALGYNIGGPALIISALTLVLNLILTGGFVLVVKHLALKEYAHDCLQEN